MSSEELSGAKTTGTSKNTVVVTDLLPQTTYIAEVRAMSSAVGQESPWSAALTFETITDTMPPAPVSQLEGFILGSAFELRWWDPHLNEDDSPLQNGAGAIVRFWPTDEPNNIKQVSTREQRLLLTVEENRAYFGTARHSITFEVRAIDTVGNESEPETITLGVPPPVAPTVSGYGHAANITLSWSGGQGHIVKYEVYRNDEKVADLGEGASTYTDSGAPRGHHQYFIRVVDPFGRTDDSDVVGIDSGGYWEEDILAPKAPTNLTYDADDPSNNIVTVTLMWDEVTENEDDSEYDDHEGYEIRYRTDPTRSWTYVVELEGTSREIDFPQGVTVQWGVRAFDRYSNNSVWALGPDILTEIESMPRPRPPILIGDVQSVVVGHDLFDVDGDRLPLASSALEVDVSHNGTAWEKVDTIPIGSMIKVADNSAGDNPRTPVVARKIPSPTTFDSPVVYVRVRVIPEQGDPSPDSDHATVGVDMIEGDYIARATITDALIENLSAEKLIAGSAFVNDLSIRSSIVVDHGQGIIRSDNYNFDQETGWAMDRTGIRVFDGDIAAKLIKVSDHPNLLDYGHAAFTYANDWYDTNLSASSATGFTRSIVGTWARYGPRALRLVNTSNVGRYLYLAKSTTDYNIRVEPSTAYIMSAYVHNNGTSSTNVRLAWRRDNNTTASVNPVNGESVAAGETKRIYAIMTTPAGVNNVLAALYMPSNGDIIVDGIQLEKQGAIDEPSGFKIGGITTISGSQITTGSITSNNYVPAVSGWNIPITGTPEFNGGIFRGTVIIGSNDKTLEQHVQDEATSIATNVSTPIAQSAASSAVAPLSSTIDSWKVPGTTEIDGANIRTGTLSASKITTGSLDASKITVLNLTVTNDMIANGISASKITTGSLNANLVNINNLTVSTGQITGTLTANAIYGGILNFQYITVSNLTVTNDMVANGISASKITTGTMNAARINGGSITGVTITGNTIQTGTSGARVYISGSGDYVRFYDSSNVSSTIKQGNSTGLETSGSFRVGGSNASGTLYTGSIYIGGGYGSTGCTIGTTGRIDANSVINTTSYMAASGTTSSGSGNPTMRMNVSTGRIHYDSSIRALKKNITPLGVEGNRILDVEVVSYRDRNPDPGMEDLLLYGAIAEDIAEVDSGLTNYDGEGNPVAIQYERFGVLLQPYVKKHEEEINSLQAQVAELKELVSNLMGG